MSTMNNTLCPHKQNPTMCVLCFHQRRTSPQATRPAADPMADLLPNLAGAPKGLIGTAPPPPVGDRSGSQLGQPGSGQPPVDPAERAKYRGEVGRVPQQANAAPQEAPRAAYSSTRDQGAEHDPNKLWEPPVRPSIIDRLPSHPQAGK